MLVGVLSSTHMFGFSKKRISAAQHEREQLVQRLYMETHNLTSWDEFRPLIRDIRKRYGALATELPDGTPYRKENQLLFRGQSDSGWELQTTLERKSAKRFDVLQYM